MSVKNLLTVRLYQTISQIVCNSMEVPSRPVCEDRKAPQVIDISNCVWNGMKGTKAVWSD